MVAPARRGAVLLALAMVGGCGGRGGNGPPPPPPPANASPDGIWVGTDPISSNPVLGLVAESGELFFKVGGAINGGVYYVGQFIVDGNTINADIDAIAMQNSHYPDGATCGTGTLGGQIVERTSIVGGVAINTDPAPPAEGHAYSNSLSLTYSSQYNRASSLATIAGNYGPSSLALTISADGALFAQDAGTGCVINGVITTIDTRFNMYAVTLSTMNCSRVRCPGRRSAEGARNAEQLADTGVCDHPGRRYGQRDPVRDDDHNESDVTGGAFSI